MRPMRQRADPVDRQPPDAIGKSSTRFRRLNLTLAILFLSLLFASGLYFWGPRDWVYRWQPYSVWLRDLYGDAFPPSPKDPETGLELRTWDQLDLTWRAANLLRQAGTNAVPAVLSALAYRDTPTKQKVEALLQKIPRLHVSFTKEDTYHWRGIRACQVLGPDAAAAVPLLAPYVATKELNVKQSALLALACIGPASVDVLRTALTNNDSYLRSGIIHLLGQLGLDARLAVPDLLKLTSDPDPMVRGPAIWALGRIKENARLVIPTLIGSLHDQDLTVRVAGAEALGAWGPEANASIPELLRILDQGPGKNGENRRMHQRTLLTLNLIDPERAERLGFKIQIETPTEPCITKYGEIYIPPDNRPLRDQFMPAKPPKDKAKLSPDFP